MEIPPRGHQSSEPRCGRVEPGAAFRLKRSERPPTDYETGIFRLSSRVEKSRARVGVAERWTRQSSQGLVGWGHALGGLPFLLPGSGSLPAGSRGGTHPTLSFSTFTDGRMRARGLTNGSVQGSPGEPTCRLSGYRGIGVPGPCPAVSQPPPTTPVCTTHVHSWARRPRQHSLGVRSPSPRVPALAHTPMFPEPLLGTVPDQPSRSLSPGVSSDLLGNKHCNGKETLA